MINKNLLVSGLIYGVLAIPGTAFSIDLHFNVNNQSEFDIELSNGDKGINNEPNSGHWRPPVKGELFKIWDMYTNQWKQNHEVTVGKLKTELIGTVVYDWWYHSEYSTSLDMVIRSSANNDERLRKCNFQLKLRSKTGKMQIEQMKIIDKSGCEVSVNKDGQNIDIVIPAVFKSFSDIKPIKSECLTYQSARPICEDDLSDRAYDACLKEKKIRDLKPICPSGTVSITLPHNESTSNMHFTFLKPQYLSGSNMLVDFSASGVAHFPPATEVQHSCNHSEGCGISLFPKEKDDGHPMETGRGSTVRVENKGDGELILQGFQF